MSTIFGAWGVYDFLLIAVVSLMAGGVAYVTSPRWKAFLSLLPLPSTLAVLALGQPVDVSFLLGLLLTALFYYLAFALHHKGGLPIVPAIAVAAVAYGLAGMAVLPVLPNSPKMFLVVFGFLIFLGVILGRSLQHVKEEGYRTSLPPYVKLPLVMAIVFLLVNMKHLLLGFMVTFPMVGVAGAYEMRRCPRTLFAQLPQMFFAVGSLMTVCFLAQPVIGLEGGLVLGWGAYLAVLLCLRKDAVLRHATQLWRELPLKWGWAKSVVVRRPGR
ncbi:MAG: hypothetical protein WC708_07120 [Lentisphaeria bacterium]